MVLTYSLAYVSRLNSSTETEFSRWCVIFLLIASLALIMKNLGFKGAPVFVVLTVTALIGTSVNKLSGILSVFSELGEHANIQKYTEGCLKVLGIGYLSGVCCDVCKELGENGVAKAIAIFTKIELIAIAAPYISEIISESIKFAGG